MSTDGQQPQEPRIVAFTRPYRYLTTAHWLATGLRRQRPAAIGALLAAWTGLAVALWLAVGGVALGALVGAIGASSLGGIGTTIGVNTGTGVLAAIVGAFAGGIAGLVLIYALLILHPLQLLGALASGAVVTTLFLLVYIRAEPLLLRMRGYREPSRRESERIYPLLLEAARAMELPVVPAVWISDQQKPGAWAHMRAIVVTRGLLGDYDASEKPPQSDFDPTALIAILAHELHHWDSADVVGLSIVSACFCPLVLIINGIGWIRERGEWLGILLWVVFWPVWVSSKLVVVPIMAKRSRQYEYDADAAAASFGDPFRLGLRRALDELSAWEVPRTGWEDVLTATHPPIEHRLERLAAERERPEPAAVTWPEPQSPIAQQAPSATASFVGDGPPAVRRPPPRPAPSRATRPRARKTASGVRPPKRKAPKPGGYMSRLPYACQCN
jgi:Zn-dependent protease with chaperone function